MLLDTNVLSEPTKPRPNENVLRFYKQLNPRQAFASALSLGELRKGIAARAPRDKAGADQLAGWVENIERTYSDQILPIDKQIARIWGELSIGRTRPVVDTLLAATAIHHNLILVTRNTRDVQDLLLTLHNPWLD